ncbi:MAG: phosphotransferase, partial [Mariprofundaceae bacterium]|nr:phosphotransferase [Mariprofundaceae bacterium]
MNHDPRASQALAWLKTQKLPSFSMQLLAGDASFRRYFRVSSDKATWILMDAPPDKESIEDFLDIQTWLSKAGLRVPQRMALDIKQGFLLLEDFADDTWAVCRQKGMDLMPLFSDALHQLHVLQVAQVPLNLPLFDVARMQRECDLYLDWYLPKVQGVVPTQEQRHAFHQGLLPVLKTLAALPCVPVHLDF